MDLVKIKEISNRITYKPGHVIELSYNHNATCVILATKYVTIDATDVTQQAIVNQKYHLPYSTMIQMEELGVINWIFDCVSKTEIHEALEWFKVDGQTLSDPHANDHIAPEC